MGSFLDTVPVSAIIKIRDLMVTLKDPFRLDQGDVSFDAPDSVKQAMARAIADNHTHYLPTTGLPRLRQLLAEKLRTKNHIPVGRTTTSSRPTAALTPFGPRSTPCSSRATR